MLLDLFAMEVVLRTNAATTQNQTLLNSVRQIEEKISMQIHCTSKNTAMDGMMLQLQKACVAFLLAMSANPKSVAVAAADNATTTIIDLSLDLLVSPNATSSSNGDGDAVNAGEQALRDACQTDPLIRTCLILEHGRIVAEYVREDVDPLETWDAWSITKSWVSLLIGHIIEADLLSLDETLNDIWPEDEKNEIWSQVSENVTNVEFRKNNITIQSLLTMTSGLVSDIGNEGTFGDGGTAGGSDLVDALSLPTLFGEPGQFLYVGVLNILSYVILERTGLSPREYAKQTLFPVLGINDDTDIDWWKNTDGIETAYHGLFLTSRQMAKFGQLYLQKGMAGPSSRYVSEQRIAESTRSHVDFELELDGLNFSLPSSYGYLFWVVNGLWIGQPADAVGDFYCAIGAGGQLICVHPDLDRVAVQQRDWKTFDQGELVVPSIAFNSATSFGDETATTNEETTSAPSSDSNPSPDDMSQNPAAVDVPTSAPTATLEASGSNADSVFYLLSVLGPLLLATAIHC